MSRITFNDNKLDPEKTYWLSTFGKVSFVEGDQPVIDVIFFEVDESVIDEGFDPQNHRPLGSAIPTQIDVGILVFLSIGCCIYKRKIILPKINDSISVSGLGVTPGRLNPLRKVRIFSDFSFGEGKTDKNIVYQNFNFPFSRHSSMYCLHYILDNKVYIFPCIELIRFYLGVSSALIERVFLDGLNHDTIFRKEKTTNYKYARHDGSDQLRLSKHMLNADVKHIARIALTEEGFRATKAVGYSIRKDQRYPIGFFPFEGETTIDVSMLNLGVYSKGHEFEGQEACFIIRIHSCSRPFARNGVEWTRDNDNRRASDENAEDVNHPKQGEEQEVDGVNANNKSTIESGALRKKHTVDTSRFKSEPDDNLFIHLEKLDQKTKNKGSIIPQEEAEYDSFHKVQFDESNAGEIKLIDSKSSFPKKDPKNSKLNDRKGNQEYVEFYQSIIKEFSTNSNFQINKLDISFDPNYIEQRLSEDKATNYAKGWKDPITKGPYYGKRNTLLTELKRNTGHSFYLLDVLPREGHSESFGSIQLIHSNDFRIVGRDQFDKLFLIFCKNQSLSPDPDSYDSLNRNLFRELELKKFDHQFAQGPKHTYDRILEFIENKFSANL
ncbi:hypothetical protein [Ekhidna sp.]